MFIKCNSCGFEGIHVPPTTNITCPKCKQTVTITSENIVAFRTGELKELGIVWTFTCQKCGHSVDPFPLCNIRSENFEILCPCCREGDELIGKYIPGLPKDSSLARTFYTYMADFVNFCGRIQGLKDNTHAHDRVKQLADLVVISCVDEMGQIDPEKTRVGWKDVGDNLEDLWRDFERKGLISAEITARQQPIWADLRGSMEMAAADSSHPPESAAQAPESKVPEERAMSVRQISAESSDGASECLNLKGQIEAVEDAFSGLVSILDAMGIGTISYSGMRDHPSFGQLIQLIESGADGLVKCGVPDIEKRAETILMKLRGKKSRAGCFIATACYGSEDHDDVVKLRTFRDTVVSRWLLGRWVIALYCQLSPPLADWLSSRPKCRRFVRDFLVHPMTSLIKSRSGYREVSRADTSSNRA